MGGLVGALNRTPAKANWERFRKALKASGLRYYKVNFDRGKVNALEDLRKASVELYDSKERPAYSIPVVLQEGKKIRGATIYLKGLLNINK